MGVNLDTLRPEPSVEGYTTPGGYSYRAVKPIALERVMSIGTMLRQKGFKDQGVSLSGIGGVETGGDAAEFILLGADTVQVGRQEGWGFWVLHGCAGICAWDADQAAVGWLLGDWLGCQWSRGCCRACVWKGTAGVLVAVRDAYSTSTNGWCAVQHSGTVPSNYS
jgi:hypothetical protein